MHLSRTSKIALLTLAAFILVTVAGAFAYDASKKNEIAPGVRIAGIDVGGHSTAGARGLLRRNVVKPLMRPVSVKVDRADYELTPKELGMSADVNGMLAEAVDASRQGGLPERLIRYATNGQVSTDLAPKISYSDQKLNEVVDKIAGQINTPPVNASLSPTGHSITPTQGRDGLKVDRSMLRTDIQAALQDGAGDRVVQPHVSRTPPQITTDQLAAKYPTYLTIDRSHFKLILWKNLRVKKTYPIAVGMQGLQTPAGTYTIDDKQVNPSWHVPNDAWAGSLAGQTIPPGPSDPLVARWLGFYNGAGIHGTNEPSSIGSAASHGCIRMLVPDVIDLYPRVPLGTPIYVG
jgi:L,D-transpeptidase-like protein/putative peptidoglycan binding protein